MLVGRDVRVLHRDAHVRARGGRDVAVLAARVIRLRAAGVGEVEDVGRKRLGRRRDGAPEPHVGVAAVAGPPGDLGFDRANLGRFVRVARVAAAVVARERDPRREHHRRLAVVGAARDAAEDPLAGQLADDRKASADPLRIGELGDRVERQLVRARAEGRGRRHVAVRLRRRDQRSGAGGARRVQRRQVLPAVDAVDEPPELEGVRIRGRGGSRRGRRDPPSGRPRAGTCGTSRRSWCPCATRRARAGGRGTSRRRRRRRAPGP